MEQLSVPSCGTPPRNGLMSWLVTPRSFTKPCLMSATEPSVRGAPSSAGSSVVELSRRHGDYAMVGLACALDMSGDRITSAALSFFGVAPVPVRVAEAEAVLVGQTPTEDVFAQASEVVSNTLDPTGDVHATADYRKHIAGVLTRKGLAEASSRIGVAA